MAHTHQRLCPKAITCPCQQLRSQSAWAVGTALAAVGGLLGCPSASHPCQPLQYSSRWRCRSEEAWAR